MARIIPAGFGELDEQNLSMLQPKELRFHEAFYFYDRFRLCCGQPAIRLAESARENPFLWIAYADAHLATLISIEEFVSPGIKSAL